MSNEAATNAFLKDEGPTPERIGKGDLSLINGVYGRLYCSHIAKMAANGKLVRPGEDEKLNITRAQAAERLARDYYLSAFFPKVTANLTRIGGKSGYETSEIDRMTATDRYIHAMRSLSWNDRIFARAIIIDDLSFSDYIRAYPVLCGNGRTYNALRLRLIQALDLIDVSYQKKKG